jgi:serine/threonine protein kinase
MTEQEFTPSLSTASSVNDDGGLRRAQLTAADIKRGWHHGAEADAAAALEDHPEFWGYRTLAIDLAHCEYRLRVKAGEKLEVDEFCRRFPSLEQSLYLLIRVQSLLGHDPALRGLQEMVPWPEPGQDFLGYRLVSELGRGTFGRVFLAHEPAIGNRQVALKVALQGADEADVLGKLRHPNIVPVYSVHRDEATGLAAFCMPYLGRATLRDVVNRVFSGAVPPRHAKMILEAVQAANNGVELGELHRPERVLRSGSYVEGAIYLAARLADALAHTHQCGICHRDLKPSNVLLSSGGEPLLLDFNLCGDIGLPTCWIGGTLPYMAPEVLAGVAGEGTDTGTQHYDPRSDLFSLGVILYETLTGVLPFGEIARNVSLDESARRLRQVQMSGPEPIQAKNHRVGGRLAALVARCLAFDPDHRPQTASELADGLRRELAPHRRVRRWVRDRRRRVSVAASLALVLVVAWIGYLSIRPPYHIRQFQRGMWYYDRGDYAASIEYFNESLRSDPKQSDALFARGRALLRQGDFRTAIGDFRDARALAEDARTDACLGYCLARTNLDEAAIYQSQQAIQKGFQSAGFFNNIGFSYRQLGRLDLAEEYLERAIAADENLAAARLNLVIVHLNQAADGRPVPESALANARKAGELGPPSAGLYLHVATLLACAARERAELIHPAIGYLEKAIAHGLDPASLRADPRFSILRQGQAFQALLTRSPGRESSAKADYLVDPL